VSVQVGTWASAGKPYRIAAFVTAAACLFGGWAYLYVKSRAVDLKAATEALAALRELKESDSRWNDWLIGTRLAAGGAGAQPAGRPRVEPTRLQSVLANLSLQNAALDNALAPGTLVSLRQALDDKAVFIRQNEVLHEAASMGRQAIPDDQHLAAHVTEKVFEKLHNLRRLDRPRE